MLQSRISVDLPSEELLREKTLGEWFLSLFGRQPDLRTGKSLLSITSYSVLEGLVDSFHRVGMDNVITLMVDGRSVFYDAADEPHDLDQMHQVTRASGVLDRDVGEMQLAFSHHLEGLSVIAEIDLRQRALVGQDELKIRLSGRIDALRVEDEESAQRYRNRVRSFAKEAFPRTQMEALDQLTEDLARALEASFVGAQVTTQRTKVRIIRPSQGQVARLRQLRFGKQGMGPRFRSAPARRRHRAQPLIDPFYRYTYDPYYDFALWVMMDTLIEERIWQEDDVYFHEPNGLLIGRGDIIDYDILGAGWDAYAAMSIDDDGAVVIDATIIPEELSRAVSDSAPAGSSEMDVWQEPTWYDDEWGLEPASVFDPASDDFVTPGWDEPPVDSVSLFGSDEGGFDDEAVIGPGYLGTDEPSGTGYGGFDDVDSALSSSAGTAFSFFGASDDDASSGWDDTSSNWGSDTGDSFSTWDSSSGWDDTPSSWDSGGSDGGDSDW